MDPYFVLAVQLPAPPEEAQPLWVRGFLLGWMIAKTVKVSEKGQIAIPAEVREVTGIRRGDELLLVQEGDRILLVRSVRVGASVRNEFAGILRHSEKIARKLWGSKADEIWDSV